MSTKVWLDFGDGYEDVSDFVRDTVTITARFASDDFKHAENVATFTLNFDYDIYARLRSATSDIMAKVQVDGESDYFIGRIPPTQSRTYDGVVSVMQIDLEAVDPFKYMDVEVGDVVYYGHTIMNPLDPTTSIVHKLAAIAGFATADIDTITIPVAFPVFSPTSETEKVIDVLDILLYENGYTLGFKNGKISPKKWLYSTPVSAFTFTQDNIIGSVEIKDNEIEWEGSRVVWYELQEKKNVLIYKEDLPYSDTGGFEGYPVISGSYYPIECNVIDDTTGTNQIVYQEYTDSGIKYLTNKAIVNALDYNYKAFKSDFSDIVATSNHTVEYSAPTVSGYTLDWITQDFGNKKAQLLLKNNSVHSINLYYLNIRADVWHKSMERKVECIVVSGTKLIEEYQSVYIYDKGQADILAQARSTISNRYGNVLYTFKSSCYVEEGSIVDMYFFDGTDVTYRAILDYSGAEIFDGSSAFDAVNRIGIVMERRYDEYEKLYTYEVKGYAPDYTEFALSTRKVKSSTGPITPSTIVDFRLSPYSVAVPTDFAGNNPVFTSSLTDLTIFLNGIQDTANWTLSAVTTSGVNGSFGTGDYMNRFTLNSITEDSGYVDFTASKSGYPTWRQRLYVFKQKDVPTVPSDIGATSPATVPKYLSKYTPLSGLPSSANKYDWALVYTSDSDKGLYLYDTSWSKLTNPTTDQIARAWMDICDVTNSGYGSVTDYTGTGVNFINVLGANIAFLNKIFANELVIQSGGHIRSSSVTASGVMPVDGKGFYINYDGTTKFANVETQGLVATVVSGSTYGFASSGKAYVFNNTVYSDFDFLKVTGSGSVTLKATLQLYFGTGTAYARFYRSNGVAVGSEYTVTLSSSTVSMSENVTVTPGDVFILRVKTSASTTLGRATQFAAYSNSPPGIIAFIGNNNPIVDARPLRTKITNSDASTYDIPYGKYHISIVNSTSAFFTVYLKYYDDTTSSYLNVASITSNRYFGRIDCNFEGQFRVDFNGATAELYLIPVM